MDIRRKLVSSLPWGLANLALATATFVAFDTVRFSGVGMWLLRLSFVGFVGTAVLAIVDLFRSGTRWRGFVTLLLCLPVLAFFGLLTVWESPLYVSVTGSTLPAFQIDGPAGFYGLEIYSPEHSNAEWLGDDIDVIWSFQWPKQNAFPPTRTRFTYGTLPTGYTQKEPPIDPAPTLNPDTTYTVVVEPAMGEPENFTLRGKSLTKADGEFAASVCWGTLNVPGRNPASVRRNCETKKPLAMSERAEARLKNYQKIRLTLLLVLHSRSTSRTTFIALGFESSQSPINPALTGDIESQDWTFPVSRQIRTYYFGSFIGMHK